MKKVGDLTAMKAGIHPGPMPDILQLSGQAQHTLQSACITGILEAEAAYIMESGLVIEKDTRHDFTDEYMELTRDFYLAF